MMAKVSAKRVDEAKEVLLELLPPGSTVYVKLEHVSRSGMMRCISTYVVSDGCIRDITYLVAWAIQERVSDKHGGIVMGGCGMDMGFALVYDLSQALYPTGFACFGERCTSNDHSNGGDAKWHTSGGYALRKEWL